MEIPDEFIVGEVDAKLNPDLAKRFRADDERGWPELILLTNQNFYDKCNKGKSKGNKGSSDVSLQETRYGGELSFDQLWKFLKGRFLQFEKC